MKHKKQKRGQKIELDAEVVADLEATDADTDAIQGGRSSGGGSIKGSVASGSGI